MKVLAALAMAFVAATTSSALGAACRAQSSERLVPLIELYTSEGCSSCPPADRWLSAQFPPGQRTDAVALAFHVDYWDRLGWKDRFAAAAHTARQYQAMRANRATFVYTPQVVVQGRDAPGWRRDALAGALVTANSIAKASIRIEARPVANAVAANVAVSLEDVPVPSLSLALAYADSGLSSNVKSGENRGERLRHDHVVRAFATRPLTSRDAAFEIRLPRPLEAGHHPMLVAFVQDSASGTVLQTLALPLAACDR